MTFGSLFAGIGGLDLGLERAGMECRWQVEIDPFCRKVLTKHWPDVPRYEDVRDVGKETIEPVDLICGGFPCQDISLAGRGAGIDGDRSGLWWEFARIIREMGPRYVLVENVSALLVRGLDRVLGDLAACGYDAEWDCIPAAAVGAPHLRDRVFILAQRPKQRRPMADARGRRGPEDEVRTGRDESRVRCETLADADRERFQEQHPATLPARPRLHTGPLDAGRDHWGPEPDVGRVADGVPARVDRLRALGNAVVPQVAEWIGRRILQAESEE
jgi:DNA (cytosine-5)-methyltransferase 1